MYVWLYLCMYVYVYVCLFVCLSVCLFDSLSVCLSVCMYVYTGMLVLRVMTVPQSLPCWSTLIPPWLWAGKGLSLYLSNYPSLLNLPLSPKKNMCTYIPKAYAPLFNLFSRLIWSHPALYLVTYLPTHQPTYRPTFRNKPTYPPISLQRVPHQ